MSNTRYTDKDGDVWEDQDNGHVFLVRSAAYPEAEGMTLSFAGLVRQNGPISLAPDRCAEVRMAALETVLSSFPDASQDHNGTVRVWQGDRQYVVDVTVREVDA